MSFRNVTLTVLSAAWKAASDHNAWWIMLPPSEFARIIDPGDQVFMLLASQGMPGHLLDIHYHTLNNHPSLLSSTVSTSPWPATASPDRALKRLRVSPGIALKQIMSAITEVERNISPRKMIETYTKQRHRDVAELAERADRGRVCPRITGGLCGCKPSWNGIRRAGPVSRQPKYR